MRRCMMASFTALFCFAVGIAQAQDADGKTKPGTSKKPTAKKPVEESREEKKPALPKRIADVVQPGTKWTGSYFQDSARAGSDKVDSDETDLRIEIIEVEDNKFTGEYRIDRGKRGLEIEGAIKSNGQIKIEVKNIIKGEWAKAGVGNSVINAKIKGERIDGKLKLPGVALDGRWYVKLKKEE